MRDCFRRKLHLQKQPKSAFVNEFLLSLVPAFKTSTITKSVGQRLISYHSAIVIKIIGPRTLHLKAIKNKTFIIISLSVIVIKLQII
jgi:hypothetical protein